MAIEIDGSNNSSSPKSEPPLKCQLGPDRNVISLFREAADADSTKLVRSLQTQKLKDTSEATLWPNPNRIHDTFPWMDWIQWEFPSPSAFHSPLLVSKSGLFTCLHYLAYFLLYLISNGWDVAQRHNRDTANSWKAIRVECRQGKITLRLLSVCTHDRCVRLRLEWNIWRRQSKTGLETESSITLSEPVQRSVGDGWAPWDRRRGAQRKLHMEPWKEYFHSS